MSEPKAPASGWALIDGVERNRATPATFHIPDAQTRAGVGVGSWAKIGYRQGADGQGERFWVQVCARTEGGGYLGRVDNDTHYDHGLRYNDVVAFGPEHVLNTEIPTLAEALQRFPPAGRA